MDTEFPDQHIEQRIHQLQVAVQSWATAKALWFDCGFQSYAERVGGEPTDLPVATILYFSSSFGDMLDGSYPGLDSEFEAILNAHGFWYERSDSVSVYIYPDEDGPLVKPLADYLRWQWICSLLQPDFADVHEEIYSHFANRPDDLHRLHWREFEILMHRVLQQQGFIAELGPGQGDGGVDIRLLQRDPIGDILTLVQVKRYAPRRKIGLEAVQALHGAASVENAQRSLFITTSAYQPAAKRFAERTSGRLILATSTDVVRWCCDATQGVIEDKSKLVDPQHVRQLIGGLAGKRDPRILHARIGVTMEINSFALVLKETRHAALLMGLPKTVLSDDGYGQRGTEVPLLDGKSEVPLNTETVWRSKRSSDAGRVSYWDGQHLYVPWDGNPQHFNYMD